MNRRGTALSSSIKVPSFGFLSSLSSSSVFFLHAIFLGGILFFKGKESIPLLIGLTAAARLFGDWLFWSQLFPSKVALNHQPLNWKASIQNALIKRAEGLKALLDMLGDVILDSTLVILAFKANAPPLLLLILFSISQGLGSLVHGVFIRIYDPQFLRKLYIVLGAASLWLALEV